MGIAKLGARLFGIFGHSVSKGKLIGTSKSGIKVFQKVAEDGTKVTSSYKNGKLYKTITQKPVKENHLQSYNPYMSTGHKTVAENHETGVSTIIKKVDNDYKRKILQYRTVFDPGVRKEFNAYKVDKNNTLVGKSYDYIYAPDKFKSLTVTTYKNGIPYYDVRKNLYIDSQQKEKFINVYNYMFPNGSKLTGNFGTVTYKDPFTNSIKTRNLYAGGAREIAITTNEQGENIVKVGNNVIN